MEFNHKKFDNIVFIGIGILSLIVCFFMDIASVRVLTTQCYFTFSGKFYCLVDRVKVEIPQDPQISFCHTVQSTPVFGGFSLALGLISMTIYYFKDQIRKELSFKFIKWGMLITLGIAIIFQLLIPMLIIDNRAKDIPLMKFTIVLEFVTLINYCIFWGLVMQEGEKNK